MYRNQLKVLLAGSAVVLAMACGGGTEQPAADTNAGGTPAATSAPAAPATMDPAAQVARGKEIFESTCAACHGLTGKGDGPGSAALDPKPRDFSNAEYMAGLTDTEIRNTIKYGGAIKGMPQMPSHPQFSEEDLNAMVAYVRTLHQ